ncbi:hypothetical protein MWU75_04405 [Ornithinimicrobium sp. F0845]|uniref:hypothetical protein n=1 Tax=Ornithinimicrobium sp. F0845 TaxID=2926412 RepID=UPI001FF31AD3|nr:hypothetical protein [Ornithinimicrobium sp. F0845]
MPKKDKKRATQAAGRTPKKKCCASKPKCSRCPLRMLAEGTLPDGYTVRKRKLVKLDGAKQKKGAGPKKKKDKRPTAA